MSGSAAAFFLLYAPRKGVTQPSRNDLASTLEESVSLSVTSPHVTVAITFLPRSKTSPAHAVGQTSETPLMTRGSARASSAPSDLIGHVEL